MTAVTTVTVVTAVTVVTVVAAMTVVTVVTVVPAVTVAWNAFNSCPRISPASIRRWSHDFSQLGLRRDARTSGHGLRCCVKKERKSHRTDEIAWQPTKKSSGNKISPGAKKLYEALGCAMDSDSDSD